MPVLTPRQERNQRPADAVPGQTRSQRAWIQRTAIRRGSRGSRRDETCQEVVTTREQTCRSQLVPPGCARRLRKEPLRALAIRGRIDVRPRHAADVRPSESPLRHQSAHARRNGSRFVRGHGSQCVEYRCVSTKQPASTASQDVSPLPMAVTRPLDSRTFVASFRSISDDGCGVHQHASVACAQQRRRDELLQRSAPRRRWSTIWR